MSGGASKLFPGSSRMEFAVSGTTINAVAGGSGPPVVLLHGYPQIHVIWHRVAPILAERFTVVWSDLRGYGDSGNPLSDESHEPYSKRVMALDQLELMRSLGFERFALVGHDRGGRVARRLAPDHPGAVTRLAVLDIIPTERSTRPSCGPTPTLIRRQRRSRRCVLPNRQALSELASVSASAESPCCRLPAASACRCCSRRVSAPSLSSPAA
jgi:pimeloyl-ACP methyl ester carboxylesterase